MTGNEIFDMSIAIIDSLSSTGVVDESETKDYEYRAPYLLDLWQREIVKSCGFSKTFEVPCYHKLNTLGEQFNVVEHTTTDQIYEGYGSSFYFGVDGTATVYIEKLTGGSWTATSGLYCVGGVETSHSGVLSCVGTTNGFNYYKGTITATGPVRLRFTGGYYRHINRALSPYSYTSSLLVPEFKSWFKLDLPDDFKSRVQVISEHIGEGIDNYRWENNDLYISDNFDGVVRIIYTPIPIKITALTQTMEVDDNTCISGAYYLAKAYALSDMDYDLANVCSAKYKELKEENKQISTLNYETINNVY